VRRGELPLSRLLAEGNVELYSFDDEYLKRLRQGDPTVEQHFFSYFSKMLLIKLRSRLRSPESVDDVRQETFLRVLRTIRAEDGIHSAQRLGSYVNSVCNFVLFEHYRAGKREDPMEEGAADPPDRTIDLHGALVTQETREQVRQILDQLDKRDRELLTAVFLEEREKDDVCRQFGVDRDYLRVLIYRAKGQFRQKYEQVN
jgi:RNA polymerase sigma-70 factor (ECF subfamily)